MTVGLMYVILFSLVHFKDTFSDTKNKIKLNLIVLFWPWKEQSTKSHHKVYLANVLELSNLSHNLPQQMEWPSYHGKACLFKCLYSEHFWATSCWLAAEIWKFILDLENSSWEKQTADQLVGEPYGEIVFVKIKGNEESSVTKCFLIKSRS